MDLVVFAEGGGLYEVVAVFLVVGFAFYGEGVVVADVLLFRVRPCVQW